VTRYSYNTLESLSAERESVGFVTVYFRSVDLVDSSVAVGHCVFCLFKNSRR